MGTIVSTSQNVTSSAGRINGTPIARGTTSGMQASGIDAPTMHQWGTALHRERVPSLLPTGTTSIRHSPAPYRESTSNSGTYMLTGTFTIDGGTGRLAGEVRAAA